ncbi:pentapeptide repeat-containing protein [Natranaeroarchaeum sulfidigenes]|uniref:Ion channel fused to ion transporting domain n=1 Tax=Natranaeroarchaeum sulfidigenes TaxID=2784880 RepID=A0A897MNK4_9EURY|nr:pentapeptide repeat-containing protein [Natranaeroarchaeum sulfidigenes]QSG02164.1 Ion channel fused to ion transporting domain [Natranaeroarchaeum sulfidigenes]
MTGVHPTAIPPGDADGSCSYRIEADVWADQYDREPRHGDWDCPRDACEGFDRCVFHLTAPERDEAGVTDDTLQTSLLAALDESGAAPKQLIGANLPELDLSHVLLDAPDNYPVELSHATIDGELAIDDAAIRQPVYFDHCEIGSLRIGASDLRGVLTFDHSEIAGETVLRDQYDRSIYFRDVTFHDEFTVKPVVFHRMARFSDSEFHARASFYADFNDEPHFNRCEFHDDVDFFVDINADSYFDDATFEGRFDLYAAVNGTLRIRNAEFFGPATLYARYRSDAFFNGSTFHDRVGFEKPGSDVGAARFYEYTDFGGVTVEGRADFSTVEFHGSVDFSGCTFDGPVTFDECRFEKRVELTDVHCRTPPTFRNATFTGSPRLSLEAEQPGLVDCTGATMTGGLIETEADDDLRYDFTDGSLGCVDLDTGDERDPLDRYRFYRTDFDGFDFSAHRSELDRNDWHVHELDADGLDTTADLDVEGLEVTYNKARNGANETDEDEAAAEFFLREMKYKKRRHAENALAADAGVVARLRAAGRLVSNATLDLTCGYGEKPWRVFAASAATVLLFALVFAGIGVDAMDEASSLGYLTLSLETFVALVLGTPTIDDPLVNLLTSVEAFLGAFFIGLFVFTLTRSIRR